MHSPCIPCPFGSKRDTPPPSQEPSIASKKGGKGAGQTENAKGTAGGAKKKSKKKGKSTVAVKTGLTEDGANTEDEEETVRVTKDPEGC